MWAWWLALASQLARASNKGMVDYLESWSTRIYKDMVAPPKMHSSPRILSKGMVTLLGIRSLPRISTWGMELIQDFE